MIKQEARQHQPVLLHVLLDILQINPNGAYIDATYGCGGHSTAVLARLGPKGSLLAFDQDLEACRHAQQNHADDPRFSIRHASFTAIRRLLDEGWRQRLAGIFFDLGVSSPQLEQAERGFSFSQDGPLDMRMNTTTGITAAEWINHASKKEITHVLRTYGEERRANKIASAIAGGPPLQTTRQLACLIASVLGVSSCNNVHPATRSFLALRLYINRELEALQEALNYVPALLRGGARLVVISFHSLEDRIVKYFIRDHSRTAALKQAVFYSPNKVIRPSREEQRSNPRCRSARLRWAEKI